MSTDAIKKEIGIKAAQLVENGMVVGLGTGTTAAFFIEELGKRCKTGLSIKAVASSKASWNLAHQSKIPLIDIDQIKTLDLTVDGADEIDPQKRMIKGGGGAFVREKIVAAMSREMVVIIDESKLVSKLGKRDLPVEIIPFAHTATLHHLSKIGCKGKWRKKPDNTPFITDNGNWIFDLHFEKPPENPEALHEKICSIPGVIDTGFFFHLAGRLVIGFFDGQIVVRP